MKAGRATCRRRDIEAPTPECDRSSTRNGGRAQGGAALWLGVALVAGQLNPLPPHEARAAGAIRRCEGLLWQIESAAGFQTDIHPQEGGRRTLARTEAVTQAGLSEHQAKTA